MVKNILLATDGSASAEKAAQFGIQLAKTCQAGLNVISVVDSGSPRSALDIDPDEIKDIEDQEIVEKMNDEKSKPETLFVARVSNMAAKAGVDAQCKVTIGNPHEEILDYAKKTSTDIIVMGSRGHGAIHEALIGSLATSVLHHGNVPVLIIPAREA